MLSILIPVYNYDVVSLVKSLISQINSLETTSEILIFDDGSKHEVKVKNRVLESLPIVRYKELPHNLGRSAIRNKLAEEAQFDYLLFLDCDIMPESESFVKNYLNNLSKAPILCGGLSYSPEPPLDNSLFLHWFYGKNREVRSQSSRQKEPYMSFLTSNFLMKRTVFLSVKFDESFTGYGHEDTLFGLECSKQQIEIFHFSNPVRHIGLDPLDLFISKRIEAVKGLDKLLMRSTDSGILKKSIRILTMEKRIKQFGLKRIIGVALKLVEPILLKNLKGSSPNLIYFDLLRLRYKLM